MIRLALTASALFLMPTAAFACQCDDPADMSEADLDKGAQWMADRGVVVAEVELTARDPQSLFETYRVNRALIGTPPEAINVQRYVRLAGGQVIGQPITSCDYSPSVGQRTVMAFATVVPTAAHQAQPPCSVLVRLSALPTLQPAGMCTQFMVQTPGMVERVRRKLAEKATR